MDKVYEDNNVCTYMDDRDREVLVFALNMFKDSILLHSKVIDIYNVLYSMMNVTIAEYAFILAIMSFTIVFITAIANIINMPKEITFAYLILFPLAITIMYEIQDRKRRRKIEKNHTKPRIHQSPTKTTNKHSHHTNNNHNHKIQKQKPMQPRQRTNRNSKNNTRKPPNTIHHKNQRNTQKTATRTLRLGQFDRPGSG